MPARDLLQLTGLALAWRLLFLLAVPRVLDTADAIHYVETAASLASGSLLGHDPKIPILYPLLGALFSKLFVADLEWACRLVSFTASTLLVIPVYLLARDLHGRSAARVAGLIVALWPWLADYGCSISTESLAVLLWFTGVWLFARGVRHGGVALYGGGAALFALSLTRPEGLFILLCTAPAAALLAWPINRATVRRLLPFATFCLVLLVANTIYNRMLSGETTANYRIGFILAEFDWTRFVQTGVRTVSDVFPVMLGPVLFLFLGVGFFYPRNGPRDVRLEACVLFFALAQWAVSLFVLSPAPRYLMAPLIALSMWSACGMLLVGERVPPISGWLRRLPVTAITIFSLVHGAVTLGSEHLGRRPREPREYKEAGRWMAEHLEPGLIFTRKPQVGYYAKMPSTGPALEENLAEALERARAANARYLVVDKRYTAAMVPALAPLLDPANAPPELTHMKTFDTWPDCRVIVYTLKPAGSAAQ
jgi:4-amino-4-deoxy-L-arabinose transferase-like glycosyltransferase